MSSPQQKSKSRSKSPSNSTKQLKKSSKVFITNMNSLVAIPDLEAKLRELFSKYGEIVDLQVKQNQQKRYSYAFLEMKDPEVIQKIIQQFNGQMFQGRRLRVEHQKNNPREFAQKRYERDSNFQRNNSRYQQTSYNERSKISNPQRSGQYDQKKVIQSKCEEKSSYRKRSVSEQDKKPSKRYNRRSKTPDKQKSDIKKQDLRNNQIESFHKNDKNEKRHEKRHHSRSQSQSSSDNYRKRHESKRSHNNNHDSKKYSYHRDRSDSRNRYEKDYDAKYERRRQKKDRDERHVFKRSRDQKRRDYSSSDSRSSSYENRHRESKKSDKKKKTRRQDERSYSPYPRRKYNN